MTQHITNFLKDKYGLTAPGKGALDQHYADLSHSYEVGTVINSKGQEATFFVVTDLLAVIKKTMEQHRGSLIWQQNIPHTEFWFKILFDKGDVDTKVILVLLHTKDVDSVSKVVLLGQFTGVKDDHEGLKLCLASLFRQFCEIMDNPHYVDVKYAPAPLPDHVADLIAPPPVVPKEVKRGKGRPAKKKKLSAKAQQKQQDATLEEEQATAKELEQKMVAALKRAEQKQLSNGDPEWSLHRSYEAIRTSSSANGPTPSAPSYTLCSGAHNA